MLSERLRETFGFWWRNLPAIALVAIPFSLLSSLITLVLGAPLTAQPDETISVNGTTLSLIFVVRTLAEAALIFQLAAILSGKARGLGECALLALAIAPAMLLCNIAVLMGSALGLLLFILPGAWIYIRLSMAPFMVALEKASPGVALKQSLLRTRTTQWEMLAGWLVMLLGLLTASAMAGAVLTNLSGSNMAAGILLDLLTAVAGALLHVFLFRYYGLTREQTRQQEPNR
ncbi:MAG: hypothetical protein V2I38_12695 [Alcanivoracaceae bacterium]|jgi:hypothetical protein|nr:hypothetical protein [Alcanivoracaceae bacterium]